MKIIDNFLNKTTMYRLVLYYLIALLIVAAVFGYFGLLPYEPGAIIFSAIFLVAVCWLTNELFAKTFGAQPNSESLYITALILALIISPAASLHGYMFLVWAGVLANASKYILAAFKKHIFNPAALAVAITALALNQSATWWVGTGVMLVFVLLGGLLVVRKTPPRGFGVFIFVYGRAGDPDFKRGGRTKYFNHRQTGIYRYSPAIFCFCHAHRTFDYAAHQHFANLLRRLSRLVVRAQHAFWLSCILHRNRLCWPAMCFPTWPAPKKADS